MRDDLKKLMSAYSRRGVNDWKNEAAGGLRVAASGCLPNAIVEYDWEIGRVIDGRPQERKFIPMPRHGYKKKGFEWCFFLPKRVRGELKSLTLFILVNRARRDCLAFRFGGFFTRSPWVFARSVDFEVEQIGTDDAGFKSLWRNRASLSGCRLATPLFRFLPQTGRRCSWRWQQPYMVVTVESISCCKRSFRKHRARTAPTDTGPCSKKGSSS